MKAPRGREILRALVDRVFGGAPGGASQPRRDSGDGFGFGPELLDEMTAVKVMHWSPPGE